MEAQAAEPAERGAEAGAMRAGRASETRYAFIFERQLQNGGLSLLSTRTCHAPAAVIRLNRTARR